MVIDFAIYGKQIENRFNKKEEYYGKGKTKNTGKEGIDDAK
jgi:hypothetical protein